MSPIYGLENFDVLGSVIAVIYVVCYVLGWAWSALVYVLSALGQYTIAKRRGIRNPWMAWVPLAQMWILGCISDQYQYVAKGKVRNRRKVLLWLTVVLLVLMVAAGVLGGFTMVHDSLNIATGLVFLFALLVLFAVAVVNMVFTYICYYDLYASCDPGNSVLYLVLSILLNVTMPFFIFFCRKKDGGMPARRKPQAPAAEALPEEAPAAAEPEAAEILEEVAVSEVETVAAEENAEAAEEEAAAPVSEEAPQE